MGSLIVNNQSFVLSVSNFNQKNFLITIKYTNFAIPKNIVSFYENLI